MHGRVKVGGKARDASNKAATPRKKSIETAPVKRKKLGILRRLKPS